MIRVRLRFLALVAALLSPAARLVAADVPVAVVQFPDRSGVDVPLAATSRVSPAQAEAEVKVKDGQADVEVEAKKLPPAILFGGDVTSYVVWAVSRDAFGSKAASSAGVASPPCTAWRTSADPPPAACSAAA